MCVRNTDPTYVVVVSDLDAVTEALTNSVQVRH